ncbi:SDR family NAD(P)-dependent oxidoreductase [Halovulum sp. GXIMD14793]
MQIEGISAIVTGGGSGLGEATARRLAADGAKVGVLDINGEAAEKVAAEIGGVALPCDVASETDAQDALAKVAGHGPLRVLVNCAGIVTPGRLVGREGPLPLADFQRTVNVNLVGTFNMMRLAAAAMAGTGALEDGERGVIVNTSSVAAQDGQIGQVAYSATKGAIQAMALPAARELAKFGIRVNTIAPGIFLTPILAQLPEAARDSLAQSMPYPQRLGDPAEFADTVAFCITNRYLNAEMIRLDGATRLPPK